MKNKSSKAPQDEAQEGMSRFQEFCCIAGALLVSAALIGQYFYDIAQKAPLP